MLDQNDLNDNDLHWAEQIVVILWVISPIGILMGVFVFGMILAR